MKIVNTANNKVLANIITNHRMSIEEALELVGYDLSQCDDDGAYIDDDGEQFWIEDCCEEADEDKGESENMKTKTLYALKRNSIWLPRRNHGKDYKAYAPLISLEAQDDCEPVELQRGESLEELKAVLNSDACRPYIDNKSGSDILYVEYYVEEAEYTRDDEEEWEFSAGSNYYEREADNTPMSDKGKANL